MKEGDDMKRSFLSIILCTILLVSTGCLNNSSEGGEHNYDTTKKMVLDIVHTEEGKKALIDVLSDKEMQDVLVLDNEVVKDTIIETLSSETGASMWSTYFEDPMFAQGFASTMEENHKDLLNKLMADADFQKYFLDILQNTQVSEQMIAALKSQPFREHLEKTIEETLNSPAFQAKMTETLLKAAEKQSEQSGGEQSDGGESGGGESGGGESDSGEGGGS